ncbi:2OG-Fe(II) oxygenase [Actinomadura chokoriensis]|uniref:2OG-Fe(II) oxygenase n=1 Tax=Actinomadura chokoriensis TaxID=454156 RepID=A0ABV4RB03_9ACTN
MTGTARERLAELLGDLAEPPSSVYLKLFMSDLSVAVDGIGPLRFPVPDEQTAWLRELGRRARFGRGRQTLTDPTVRDTWEIPKELVSVEWTEAFDAALAVIRDGLGLPAHCELTPDLHSMLLYETGQFFVTHQDSEKDDTMVGTLVVTLPSVHTGGELVIEHLGDTAEYRGSKVAVSLVAFYADCRHQVLPIKTGNRITLTYNLFLTGPGAALTEDALTEELAACLTEHFATPARLLYGRGHAEPPIRLAYLLDHEYTASGFSWSRLKGSDAQRAALLRAAADRAGCDVVLALAEIQETWDALDPDPWNDSYYEGEEEHKTEDPGDDGEYVLQDLIDSSITLARWTAPEEGSRPEDVSLTIRDHEVAVTTPSSHLTPYEAQYEGYMGNYGNTLDRWYRRAALVIWPRARRFSNRAQATPKWAMDELERMISAGNTSEAQEVARTLLPFWDTAIRSDSKSAPLAATLRAVGGLDEPETATALLRPFELVLLAPGHAPLLAGLAGHYGDAWMGDLQRVWFESWRRGAHSYRTEVMDWLCELPLLAAALLAAGPDGKITAHRLLEQAWNLYAGKVRSWLTGPSTSSRDTWLSDLGRPLAGILTAAAQTEAHGVLDEAVRLGRTPSDQTALLVVSVLRAAGEHATGNGRGAVFGDLAAGCAGHLQNALARPQRATGDWSIDPPEACSCELCETLAAFLRDRASRSLEWPLAKQGRSHIHSRIDAAELPVRHQTRRQGRPYTLVLTKTEALFDTERLIRERHRADLAWITESWTPKSDALPC